MWAESIAVVSKFCGHLCFKCLGIVSFPSMCSYSCGVFSVWKAIGKVGVWGVAPAYPLLPFQQSILNGSSQSLALLNREQVSHFPHKINADTRGGNGPDPNKKEQQNYVSHDSRFYLQCSK